MSVDTRDPAAVRRPAVLILGATSAIGRAIAEEFGRKGYALVLASRDEAELGTLEADLRLRLGLGSAAQVQSRRFEASALDTHEAFVAECRSATGDSLAGAVVCFGYLGDQHLAERDPSEARRILEANLLGAVSILSVLANHFEEKRGGFLCAISSVAGDRGRQSNYFYGSAKAGLNTFLQGLRNRLFASGVRVTTIKPGFVDTAMTYGRTGMFLVAAPEAVGRRVVRAILRGTDVSYVPGFWRPILWVIRAVPEGVFKRLRL